MFDTRRLDVRLSLGTADRLQARDRGAALTAATRQVLEMLNERIKPADARPTEEELQAIARAAYGERLAQFCDDQRASPHHAAEHSLANRTWGDFYDRLARNGGHLPILAGEEQAWRMAGWDSQRAANLRTAIEHVQDGNSPISRRFVDHHLRENGYLPHDGLRRMVERARYPAYRDACRDAEKQLQASLGFGGVATAPEAPASLPAAAPGAAQVSPAPMPAIPEEWLHCTPAQAAERMIAETPKLLEHRREGKRAKESVGEQTLRQIRWAAILLEKSLPPRTPLWKVTKQDILALDRFFDRLPVHFGKSIYDRDPTVTLDVAAAKAANDIESGELAAEDVGLSIGTTNRHFGKLGQVHKFMRKQVGAAPYIDFTEFVTEDEADEREARLRYTREQGEAIFRLPPWTGCVGTGDRLTAGKTVIHDGLFYVLLLVWYTGARREELCKLMLDDVEKRHGIWYLLIRPTVTGRIKNRAARRVNVVASELIRLGFLRYVEAMRAAGETLLFPELMPGGETKRKLGDVFYKNWWIYLKPLVPDLKRGQAMHAARHMVADELKDQEVFIEFRNDHLGHTGAGGEGMTRYPNAASLSKLKVVADRIPIVTAHLPAQEVITLLPKAMRMPRPTRQKEQSLQLQGS